MADTKRCPECGSALASQEADGLCSGCRKAKESKAPSGARRALRLLAICGVVIVVGVGTAAYLARDAMRQREAIVSKAGDAGAHFDRGVALYEQGKLPEAIAEYRASLRIIPGSPEAHFNLGIALQAQGDAAAAKAEYRQARDNSPRGSELYQESDRALTALEK